jgi:ABC-type uncharacterized transport system substrate-binding protein
MRPLLRHLLPGLALIAAASAALLFSDLGNRGPRPTYNAAPAARSGPVHFAVLQFASNPVMDATLQGIVDGLASRGYRDGDRLQLKVFNAEGDLPTANQMASLIVGGGYDLGATISTICLQALASADRSGRVPFVFCAVSDPLAANIGIRSLDTLDKPAHVTGYGTSQPVEAIFREAVAANPNLKVVGVVWNPAEANSLACTKRARAICKELGLTLLEAPIEGSRDVREAADSLVSRGVEAFWTGGDATIISAYDVLQQSADKARIPIFSNISSQAQRGALFDYGADYHQVGYQTGLLAADILDGQSTASIPARNLMPARVGLNEKTRASLRDNWTFTPDQYARAAYIVQTNGTVREITPITNIATSGSPASTAAPASASIAADLRPVVPPSGGKLPWHIELLLYVETAPCEQCITGLLEGLHQSGLVEGRDFTLRQRSAQNDMATLSSLFDAAATDNTDLYLTFSTPTLQNAVRKVKTQPVVFTFVSDPMIAGAAQSYENHLPNLTGVSTLAPAGDMMRLIKTYFPQWKTLGTLYCPAEINSVQTLKMMQQKAEAVGLQIVAMPANSISELADAARALAGKNLDAIVQLPDNLSAAGFATISQAANSRHLPLFAFQSPLVDQGASLAVSMDYHQAGLDAAAKAARIMRGDNPANIPITLASHQVLALNLRNAAAQGITFPDELRRKADRVVP